MARSTGPILAAGAITWANVTLFEKRGVSFDMPETMRIVVATGIASAGLSLLGKFSPDLAYGLSLAAILTVLVVPVGGTKQSPATRALDFVKF
jgi:hypothetical protein